MYMERGCFFRVVRWLGLIFHSSRTERLHRLTVDSDSVNAVSDHRNKKSSELFLLVMKECVCYLLSYQLLKLIVVLFSLSCSRN